MISSREFRVNVGSRLPPANSWICWLECQFRSRTSCAARPENLKTICSSSLIEDDFCGHPFFHSAPPKTAAAASASLSNRR